MTAMTRSMDILRKYPFYWIKVHMDKYRNDSNTKQFDSYIAKHWDRIVKDTERYVQYEKPESDIVPLSEYEMRISDYVFKRYVESLTA